jgi:hypothetical protein
MNPGVNPTDEIDTIVHQLDALFGELEGLPEGEAISQALRDRADRIQAMAQACRATSLFPLTADKFEQARKRLEQITHPSQYLARAWNELLDQIAHADGYLQASAYVVFFVPLVALYLPAVPA